MEQVLNKYQRLLLLWCADAHFGNIVYSGKWLAAAVVQADRASGLHNASSSFATTFDQQVQLLVNDLVKASGQIGIVRTSFEQRPGSFTVIYE